ncbi:hypothetical protein [Pseudomonas protegens]|uniref:hypothetical protein n=1 Tax=Pseudomonas protegens TaxID=380021 RepID=UPI001607CC74|nr:hypothetical protein [Pseudomonas protegens]
MLINIEHVPDALPIQAIALAHRPPVALRPADTQGPRRLNAGKRLFKGVDRALGY